MDSLSKEERAYFAIFCAEVKIQKHKKIDNLDELLKAQEYFIHNKNLDLVSVNDSSVTFMVKGQLLYFDEENAKRCINNGRSPFYY